MSLAKYVQNCRYACFFAATLSLAMPTQGEENQSIVLTADVKQAGTTINRNIFGQFAEHLGTGVYGGVWVGEDSKIPNVRGIRTDVVAALKDLKVPNVRWPGGCFADKYHWRDGIGPQQQRRKILNTSWGNVIEPNAFGTHEFMDFAEQIGADVYLNVNMASGTVQEAANWLEYITADAPTTLRDERVANGRQKPWQVTLLGLGNETWGCGGSMEPTAYLELMKRYSAFSQNLNPESLPPSTFIPSNNPMLRIVSGPEEFHTDYTNVLMKAWSERSRYWGFEGLAIHYYTAGPLGVYRDSSIDFGESEYAQFVKNTYEMDRLIRTQSEIMDRYDPDKKVMLAVDEWGVWLKPLAGTNMFFLNQQNTLRDGILASINLNIFARHSDRVRLANIAQMVNVLQAMILTDKEKMVLTPTYHVFKMYVPFQDAKVIPLEFDEGHFQVGDIDLPKVDGFAAMGKDGNVYLALTNISPNDAVSIKTVLKSAAIRSVTTEVLSAEKVNSYNSFDHPDQVKPATLPATLIDNQVTVELPPKSVTVMRLNL